MILYQDQNFPVQGNNSKEISENAATTTTTTTIAKKGED